MTPVPLRFPDLTLQSAVQVAPGQISCDLGGEAAILNLNTGMYYALNPVGARIWTLVSNTVTVAAVRDTVVSEYRVGCEECERDVFEILRQLADAGLIEIHAA
jgi:hypothetical protein